MKRIVLMIMALLILSATVIGNPAPGKSPQRVYIDQFASLAVEEMYRSGVPASITLAQGLLESNSGQSVLAVKGNNHFGIKCHSNWKGKKMYHDDDRKGECFRVYPSPEQSYKDHSDFLRYRERYSFLFDYKVTDYKSWAYGLKKAGYATDPAYPKKLIQIIEEYDLHEYDKKPSSYGKTKKKAASAAVAVAEPEHLPEAPSRIDDVKHVPQEQRQDFHFNMSRELYTKNGVRFTYSVEGDTYSSLAASYNLFPKEILRFNDLNSEQNLAPGTVVYLQPKKKQAAKGLDKHVVEEGETMRELAQKYAVKLSDLYKMNGMSDVDVPREGDIIKLRK